MKTNQLKGIKILLQLMNWNKKNIEGICSIKILIKLLNKYGLHYLITGLCKKD